MEALNDYQDVKGCNLGRLQHRGCFQLFDALGRQECSGNKKTKDCQEFQRVEYEEINKRYRGKLQASKSILFGSIMADIRKRVLRKPYVTSTKPKVKPTINK